MTPKKYQRAFENSNVDFFAVSYFQNMAPSTPSILQNEIYLTDLPHSHVISKMIECGVLKGTFVVNVMDCLCFEWMVSEWRNKVKRKYKPFVYFKNELAVDDHCLIGGGVAEWSFHFS